MRIVTDEKDRQAYKEFLEKHERCNFQQSPEWAKVKENWINEIVLAEDESGKIIGAVSILIRKIPIFGNIMYSSRGPTCDIHDISVMKQLTDGIKELAKKYKAIVYKAEPDILSSDEEYRKIVTSLGYKIKDDVYDFRGVSGVVDENHPQYGLYRFKKGFGATFTEFVGEVYIPFKPFTYSLYKFSEKAFRNLRGLKTKFKK